MPAIAHSLYTLSALLEFFFILDNSVLIISRERVLLKNYAKAFSNNGFLVLVAINEEQAIKTCLIKQPGFIVIIAPNDDATASLLQQFNHDRILVVDPKELSPVPLQEIEASGRIRSLSGIDPEKLAAFCQNELALLMPSENPAAPTANNTVMRHHPDSSHEEAEAKSYDFSEVFRLLHNNNEAKESILDFRNYLYEAELLSAEAEKKYNYEILKTAFHSVTNLCSYFGADELHRLILTFKSLTDPLQKKDTLTAIKKELYLLRTYCDNYLKQ